MLTRYGGSGHELVVLFIFLINEICIAIGNEGNYVKNIVHVLKQVHWNKGQDFKGLEALYIPFHVDPHTSALISHPIFGLRTDDCPP